MYQKLSKFFNRIYSRLNDKFSFITFLSQKLQYHQSKISSDELNKVILRGENNRVSGSIMIFEYRGLVLGSNIQFNDNIALDARGGIFIGDNTYISQNVNILSSVPHFEGNILPFENRLIVKPVYIGRNVWIDRNVNISPGVKIGNGSIIKMGSNVENDFPALSIVSGNPARIIGKRDEKKYNLMDEKKSVSGIGQRNEDPSEIPVSDIDRNVIFVIGTGRSGSHAIVHFLNQSNEITAFHEPNWRLLALSIEKETALKSSNEVVEELKLIYKNHSIIKPGQMYVESDQKLSNLIKELSLVIPKSRFIWMIRKPEKFIRSAVARGWFTEPSYMAVDGASVFDPGYRTYCLRISADVINDRTYGEWSELDQIDRCAWYWNYWNDLISTQLNEISPERWIIIDIDSLGEKKGELSDFLGLNLMKHRLEKTNVVKKKDIKGYKKIDLLKNLSNRESVKKCLRLYEKLTS